MPTDYILQALQERRDNLARKLKAREGSALYAENVEELKAALAALDAELAARQGA